MELLAEQSEGIHGLEAVQDPLFVDLSSLSGRAPRVKR